MSVATGAGSTASRGSVLIRITVDLRQAKAAELAADALGQAVIVGTTSKYVNDSIGVLQASIKGDSAQLTTLGQRIEVLNKEIAVPGLDALTKIVLVSELDNSAQRQATISNNLATQQQQLSLAQSIENAQLIGPPARAVKTTARSRRNSILVGLLIGLIVASIVAIVVDTRASRARSAA